MGRLIDADKLLEETRRDRDYARKNGFLDMYYEGQVLIDRIKSQPTAYDVDKVVEQLEKQKSGLTEWAEDEAFKLAIHKAIEIVKQGGVFDDVCEWKYTKEIMDNAEFKVGCNQNALKRGIVPNNFSYHDFKYCPYCGKKIKVVE